MIELRLILNKLGFLIWFALYYFFLIIKKNNMGNKSSSIKCKIDATIIFHLNNNKKIFEKLKIKSTNIFYNNMVIKYEINKRLSNLINDDIPFELEFINKDSKLSLFLNTFSFNNTILFSFSFLT